MADPEKVRLLFGPYRPPPLKRGDRAFCLFRGALVVVTGRTGARIPWPLCHLAGYRRPCGRGILVDDELARAIRHESATAVKYWWGVSRNTARRWRGAFGVGRRDNEGTHRLVLGAIQVNMDTRGDDGRVWTRDEVALLGALPDAEVARRTGRTANAVTVKRRKLGRPRAGKPSSGKKEQSRARGAGP